MNMEQFIPKRIRFVILAFFIPCSLSAYGNSRDTILSSVYSTPFFYNVLMNKEGEIYTGTAEGVFKLEGNQLIPIDEEKEGYITLNKEGNPVINPDGIRNYKERSYAYLLPYPDLEIDEYHAGTEENFYICSGGRIYIFDIVPYTYSYPNHSIRTISENFVGTYSGIYLKNKRMNNYLPNFTDGYIREYDGKAFICYDWLMILEPSALATSIIDTSTKNAYEITYKKSLQFRDVFRPDQRSGYYVATASELLKMDQTAKNLDSIYSSKDKINKEIGIIGESRGSMYFTDGPYVLICGLSTNQIDTILELTEPILDGSIDNRHLLR